MKSDSAYFHRAGIFVASLIISVMWYTSCSKFMPADETKQIEKPPIQGIVLFAVGDITVKGENTVPHPLAIQDKVSQGDTIVTGEKSFTTIQFQDIGLLRIQENTIISMNALFADDRGEIYLEQGQVLSKLNRLKKETEYRVKTPTAVASVRGTEYSASYINGKSLVSVRTGKVAVSTPQAAGADAAEVAEEYSESTIIDEGKTAVITKSESTDTKDELKVEVRPITEVEDLTVKKISIVAMVPEPEKKTKEELSSMQENIIKEEIKIDKELNSKVKEEKIISMIKKKENTLAEIKEVFERIDEISLYNGRVIQGAIISRGETYKILTTTGTVDVNESDIKKVKIMK